MTRYEGVKVLATSTPMKKEFEATHVPIPSSVRAIYMTSCVAGTPSFRADLVDLIDKTEINSVVIDVKDSTGTLSYVSKNPELKAALSPRCYAPDMQKFVESLHQKGIYVIARIAVFQDPYLVKLRPDLAVKRASDGGIWKDYKGLNFTDPGAKDVWDHTILVSKEAYAMGFDELNFDYVRFPSDGNMKDIAFPWSGKKPKAEVLREFFAYLHKNLEPTGAVLSADLFGMTTTNTDDLNIGQVLEYALPYFDYIAPMVYPSHYPRNFLGFQNPADKPYEIIKFSMDAAVKRTIATTTPVAMIGQQPISTSTKPFLYKKKAYDANKIRPWLQDFNLGATYTADMVQKQIQATYDSGLDSWMLWNAGNRYTRGALLPKEVIADSKMPN
ncbi:MAG: putative glycoside hydrolase [Patescibacteria group bacterium]